MTPGHVGAALRKHLQLVECEFLQVCYACGADVAKKDGLLTQSNYCCENDVGVGVVPCEGEPLPDCHEQQTGPSREPNNLDSPKLGPPPATKIGGNVRPARDVGVSTANRTAPPSRVPSLLSLSQHIWPA